MSETKPESQNIALELEIKNDFNSLTDGQQVILVPNQDNPIHHEPVIATYTGGYFYCEGSDPTNGPDYYLGDVARFNTGFTLSL